MGTLEPWEPSLPPVLSPNNLGTLFSIILSPVPSFHLVSLHLVSFRLVSHPFVTHYLVPIIVFASCLPSSLHLGVLGHLVFLYLVSHHPCVLSPIIISPCLSWFYLASFCVPSYPLPSSLHPQQQKALGLNLWKQSSRYNGLDPNLWLCTRVPIILFPIIPSSCFPSSFIPSSRLSLYCLPISLHLVSLYVVGLHLFSHFLPFSPIIISLSCPPLPSSYFPASLHVASVFPPFVFHNHLSKSLSLILSTVAPSSWLRSCCLALLCFPSSFHLVPYLLSLSLSFPILFILSPIILSLPVRFLTMCWVWSEVIFWLCCCWVAQLGYCNYILKHMFKLKSNWNSETSGKSAKVAKQNHGNIISGAKDFCLGMGRLASWGRSFPSPPCRVSPQASCASFTISFEVPGEEWKALEKVLVCIQLLGLKGFSTYHCNPHWSQSLGHDQMLDTAHIAHILIRFFPVRRHNI